MICDVLYNTYISLLIYYTYGTTAKRFAATLIYWFALSGLSEFSLGLKFGWFGNNSRKLFIMTGNIANLNRKWQFLQVQQYLLIIEVPPTLSIPMPKVCPSTFILASWPWHNWPHYVQQCSEEVRCFLRSFLHSRFSQLWHIFHVLPHVKFWNIWCKLNLKSNPGVFIEDPVVQ